MKRTALRPRFPEIRAPQVTAYWCGPSRRIRQRRHQGRRRIEVGKPWDRLMASYRFATRVMRRMTDSEDGRALAAGVAGAREYALSWSVHNQLSAFSFSSENTRNAKYAAAAPPPSFALLLAELIAES
jgi:hypothetical protein